MKQRVRVLIVDDSAVARLALTNGLSADADIDVVGTARDPFDARDKILQLDPDVLTLDVEMPKMDGVEFLRRLMPQRPIPTVVVSSLTPKGGQVTLDALAAGAVDVVLKPTRNLSGGLEAMLVELRQKVKAARGAHVAWRRTGVVAAPRPALAKTTDKIVGIGASTGGTEAVREVLEALPANAPGIVIVQHMPPGFTAAFARRLDETTGLRVEEAKDGDRVFAGRALIAPAGVQCRLMRSGGEYRIELGDSIKTSGHCPSVDVLLGSVAKAAGANGVGVVMTGMGADGAAGLLEMRRAGARTIAQDQASSVVWGMPKVAWETGAAERLEPLGSIASAILRAVAE